MRSIDVLKEALPYIRRFNGARFVVKISGQVVEEPERLTELAQQIVLLHFVGIRILLVHGGGPQATRLSEALGIESTIIQGRRVTDEKTLDVAKMVFAGKINVDILGALRRHGARVVGLSGIDGNIISARRRGPTRVVDHDAGTERDVDFGFVGEIEGIDITLLTLLLDSGYLPVISSLGADDDGVIYNINADTVATEIAIAMKAEKLILLTNVPGVLAAGPDGPELVSELDLEEARTFLESGRASGGMIPKIENAIRALEGGVDRTQIISGQEEGNLLREIFTKRGTGTMIVQR